MTPIKPIAPDLFKLIIRQIIRTCGEITNENVGRKKEARPVQALPRPKIS
jgi:hypothetical protein